MNKTQTCLQGGAKTRSWKRKGDAVKGKRPFHLLAFPGLITFLFSHITAFATDDLVKFPAGNAVWTVEFSYPKTPAPPASAGNPAQAAPVVRKAQKIEITQLDNIKRIQIMWTDGKTSERWTIPGLSVVFETLPWNENSVAAIENGSIAKQFAEYTMPYDSFGFHWITPRGLQEKNPVSHMGKMCFYYKGSVPPPTVGGPPTLKPSASQNTPDWQAWIDSETLLPVALDTGTAICVFTFQKEPPRGPLALPPKFQKEIAYYKKVMGLP